VTDLRNLAVPAVGLAAAALLAACASKAPAAQSAPMAPARTTFTAPTTPTTPATPTTPQRLWPSANPPGQPALDVAAHDVETALKAKYANWYSGLAVQEPLGPDDKTPYALLIYRIPNPALDAAAQAAAPDTKIIFFDAKYSFVQCDALDTEVTNDHKYWAGQGLTINSWGCKNGLVTIGVTVPDKWKAALTARYGADRISVEAVGPAVAD
jgi:hypothetical protein